MFFPFKRTSKLPGFGNFAVSTYSFNFSLDKIVPGVDNVRHDVHLSPSFIQAAGMIVPQIIAKNVQLAQFFKVDKYTDYKNKITEFKRLYRLIIEDAINKSKLEQNPQIDYLAQTAVMKMLITDIRTNFESTSAKIKNIIRRHESSDHQKVSESAKTKESLSNVLQNKDAILRNVGMQLFSILTEVNVNELKMMREANFGAERLLPDNALENPILHTQNPYHDALLIDEYDVIFGQRLEDPHNYDNLINLTRQLYQKLYESEAGREQRKTISKNDDNAGKTGPKALKFEIDRFIKQIDNIDILLNSFQTREKLKKQKKQKTQNGDPHSLKTLIINQNLVLKDFYEFFRRAKLIQRIAASYEMRSVYRQYCPPLAPQQILLFMIDPKSRKAVIGRLKKLKKIYHQPFSVRPLKKQIKRLEMLQVKDKKRYLIRFLNGFVRYHRDFENYKIFNEAMDRINLTAEEEILNLSRANNTLYEFLLPSEKKEGEKPIINHVVIKADVRGSTDITHQMNRRGLNPASYFSLNFFNPISDILKDYGSLKVFIEGDAIILSISEREKTPEGWYSVARACGLAINMLAIIKRYNEKNKNNKLPILELGIGVNYLNGPPTFLFDGNKRIMISPAINLADRQSSCSKPIRELLTREKPPFNLYVFQSVTEEELSKTSDDLFLRYNVNGIELNADGFKKLSKEIKLSPFEGEIPELRQGRIKLYTGKFPLTTGKFQRLIIRETNIPRINPETFQTVKDTAKKYYEVCTHPKMYKLIRKLVR